MRLDKYLKVSRLIKRRTVANEACDGAKIKVNDKIAKPSYNLKMGDIIELSFPNKSIRVEVTQLAEHALKNDAGAMYRVISED